MKVSIVTITRDNLEGLKRTVASVRAQRCGTDVIQHIVVDGMSADGTSEWLSGQSGLTVVEAEPCGVYNAINRGVAVADGDIIMSLHASDTFADDTIVSQVVSQFEHDNELSYLYGDLHYVDDKGRTVRYYSGRGCGIGRLKDGYAPPHPTLVMRREVAREAGPYSEDYIIAADFEMFGRLFCNPRFKYVYLPLDMVAMQAGGISADPFHRLVTNNRERLRALRRCGLKASRLRILRHYLHVISSNLWPKKR